MIKNNNIPYEFSDYALEKYFRSVGERQGWLNESRIIVSVSGGGDSIALLWLCWKFFNGEIFAVHINHGIRGSEADEDERFTANFARAIDCGFVGVKVHVPEQKLKGESLESAARRLRYQNIISIAKIIQVNNILLGHNRDDLAETVLFNLLRGTGIRGSVGMTEQTEIDGIKFFRPLLGLRRNFLRDVLRFRGLTWCEDRTNYDAKYTRNFIRLKLLPLIERRINTSAVEHLASFGEDMRKVRDFEDDRSKTLLDECCIDEKFLDDTEQVHGDKYILDRKKLRALDDDDIALIIREIGREFELKTLSRERCFELARLIKQPAKFTFQWCRGFNIKSMRGKIFFEDKR